MNITNTYTNQIPSEMKRYDQWIIYRVVPRESGKLDKVPVDPVTGIRLSWNNPAVWMSFDKACEALGGLPPENHGLGFVLTEQDPFLCVDLDHSVDDESNISEFAKSILNRLPSFTELSVSQTGLHIWCLTRKPLPSRTQDKKKAAMEIYQKSRFIAVTGVHVPDTPLEIRDCTEELLAIHREYLGGEERSTPPSVKPVETEQKANIDIRSRIRMARDAANGAEFSKLWNGDMSDFADDSEDGVDHSAADASLCARLAFWLNRDPALIDQAFRQSKLMRDKWNRADYREKTIQKAISLSDQSYSPWGGDGKAESEPSSVSGSIRRYHHTDTGNGQHFVDMHIQNAMYVPDRGWFVWSGKVWKNDHDNAGVFELAKTVAEAMRRDAETLSASDEEEPNEAEYAAALMKWASASENVHKLNDMLAAARTDPRIRVDAEQLDRHPHLLTFANGVVDLRTGELMTFDPELRLTQLVPEEYDPAAKSDEWESFLRTVTRRHPDLIDWLQNTWGYAITGYKAEEKVFLFEGEGGAGKGSMFSIIKAAFGKDVVKDFRAETFLDRKRGASAASSDLLRLRDCRIAISSEIEKGSSMAQSLIKSISGNDGITGRGLFQNEDEFRAKCQLVFQANGIPTLDAVDGGNQRRWLRVPFDNKIASDPEAEFDSHLKARLSSDPGVLRAVIAWVVEGAIQYYANGLGMCPSVEEATRELFEENDRLLEFINTRLIRQPERMCSNVDLYNAYTTWAEESNEYLWSQKKFVQEFRRRDFRQEENGHRRWFGIRLRAEGEALRECPRMTVLREKSRLEFTVVAVGETA